MESVVQERIEKERKQSKIRHCRGENGYQKEELAQEEKYDEKTRGPELQQMPEEGEENEKQRFQPSRFDVLPPTLPIFTKFSRFIIKF